MTDPTGNSDVRPPDGDGAATRADVDDPGLSLDELGAAFARMLGAGSDPYAESPVSDQLSGPASAGDQGFADEEASDPARAAGDDDCELSPRTILEALLFVGHPNNEPLTAEQVAGMMRGVRAAEIDELVLDLNEQYLRAGCPYGIVSRGAGYVMSLRDEFAGVRDTLHGRLRQARLSPAALEVLALVAYNQPLSGEDVSRLRGRSSGAILTQLVRRQLLRIERQQTAPRAARYFTTPRFLNVFGLESLDDLPRGQEVEPK